MGLELLWGSTLAKCWWLCLLWELTCRKAIYLLVTVQRIIPFIQVVGPYASSPGGHRFNLGWWPGCLYVCSQGLIAHGYYTSPLFLCPSFSISCPLWFPSRFSVQVPSMCVTTTGHFPQFSHVCSPQKKISMAGLRLKNACENWEQQNWGEIVKESQREGNLR